MIKNKFLHYNTLAQFQLDLGASQISHRSIAFIKDKGYIWTHGTYYGIYDKDSCECLKKLKFKYENNVLSFSIDGGNIWHIIATITGGATPGPHPGLSKEEIDKIIEKIKEKLGELNKYVLPVATSTKLGGIKVGYVKSGNNHPVKVDNEGNAYVTVKEGSGTPGPGPTPTTKFKSYVFKRSASKPTKPVGGTYDNPIPSGWTDSVQQGTELIWMSSSWFTSDDPNHSDWSDPTLLADSADFDVEFSMLEKPAAPIKLADGATTDAAWHAANPDWKETDDPTVNNPIWMATCNAKNGVWSKWVVTRISGEKGEDGTSIRIRGSLDGTNIHSILDMPKKKTDPRLKQPVATGDCYVIQGGPLDGHLMCITDIDPDGTLHWTDLGKIKGTPGESTYVHIKFTNNENCITNPALMTAADLLEYPAKYIGIYTDNIKADSNIPSKYRWSKFNGEDGFGYQYIYTATYNYNAPKCPKYTDHSQFHGFTDENNVTWHDDQMSLSETNRYIWRCWIRTDINDNDGYWNGIVDGGVLKAVLVAQWKKGDKGDDGHAGKDSGILDCDNDMIPVQTNENGISVKLNQVEGTFKIRYYEGADQMFMRNDDVQSVVSGNIKVEFVGEHIEGPTNAARALEYSVKTTGAINEIATVTMIYKKHVALIKVVPFFDTPIYSLSIIPNVVKVDKNNKFVGSYVGGNYKFKINVTKTYNTKSESITSDPNVKLQYAVDDESLHTLTSWAGDTDVAMMAYNTSVTFYLKNANGTILDAETIPIIHDGKDGSGTAGKDGLQGCVTRVSVYNSAKLGQYVNDYNNHTKKTIRYIDVVAVQQTDGSYEYWMVKPLDNEGSRIPITAPGNQVDWEKLTDVGNIYANMLIANNANIVNLASRQIVVYDNNGKPVAGLLGGGDGKDKNAVRLFAGLTNSLNDTKNAKFNVRQDGSLYATDANLSGVFQAIKGADKMILEPSDVVYNWHYKDYLGNDKTIPVHDVGGVLKFYSGSVELPTHISGNIVSTQTVFCKGMHLSTTATANGAAYIGNSDIKSYVVMGEGASGKAKIGTATPYVETTNLSNLKGTVINGILCDVSEDLTGGRYIYTATGDIDLQAGYSRYLVINAKSGDITVTLPPAIDIGIEIEVLQVGTGKVYVKNTTGSYNFTSGHQGQYSKFIHLGGNTWFGTYIAN